MISKINETKLNKIVAAIRKEIKEKDTKVPEELSKFYKLGYKHCLMDLSTRLMFEGIKINKGE